MLARKKWRKYTWKKNQTTLNPTILGGKTHTIKTCVSFKIFSIHILLFCFIFKSKSQKWNMELEMLHANISSFLHISSYLIPLSLSSQNSKIRMINIFQFIKGISGLNKIIQIIWVIYWLIKESVNVSYITITPSYNLIWSLKMDHE